MNFTIYISYQLYHFNSKFILHFYITLWICDKKQNLRLAMERSSDLFRKPPGRWLGYYHVLGNALPTWAISPIAKLWMFRTTVTYVAFDTVYNAIDNRRPNPVLKAADALIWQGLASILLPGLVIGGVARGSNILMETLKVAKPMNRFIPLGLVILTLPLFGNAMDQVVDTVMDNTTRPLLLRWFITN